MYAGLTSCWSNCPPELQNCTQSPLPRAYVTVSPDTLQRPAFAGCFYCTGHCHAACSEGLPALRKRYSDQHGQAHIGTQHPQQTTIGAKNGYRNGETESIGGR